MTKKKRKKYSFLAEQKRIEEKEFQNLIHAFKEDKKLAHDFLNNYTPNLPRLYQQFQAQLEAPVTGCIYLLLDKKKATDKGIPLESYFVSKTFFEQMPQTSSEHPGIENLLDYIGAWEKDRKLVPLAVNIGYWLEATTFPVPSEQALIDSQPLPPTSSSGESPQTFLASHSEAVTTTAITEPELYKISRSRSS